MNYVLRTRNEPGYLGMDYFRSERLGKAGLVQETYLGSTAVQLAGDNDARQPKILMPNAFERRMFGGRRSGPEHAALFDQEVADLDLDGLVTSGVATWTEVLTGKRPLGAHTHLVEQRTPSELTTSGGLIVLSPELAANHLTADEFQRFNAEPEEIAAINRVQNHVLALVVRSEEPGAPGAYL